MKKLNIAQFASELGLPVSLLLEQLKAAGVSKDQESDSISEKDKSQLLLHLQARGAEKPTVKITLNRRETTEIKKADSSGSARTIQAAVRKRREEAQTVVAEAGAPLKEREVSVEIVASVITPLANVTATPAVPELEGELALEYLEQLIPKATQLAHRFDIANGKTGWSYGKIFLPELLKGATCGLLVEPYLLKHHQVKNLIDFFTAIQGATKLKNFWVVTGITTDEKSAGTDAKFNKLAEEIFQQAGFTLHFKRVEGIHDRHAVFNNGVMFKLGRGLDIFKPAGGLALNNQELREVRACGVDVFRTV